MTEPLSRTLERLARGETTSVALVHEAISRARDARGEGARTFTRLYEERATREAAEWDAKRRAGAPLPPLAGLPISIKDLFDVAGETTLAGSRVLASHRPAAEDAEVVARLRRAGAVIVGKTNMTEFAFSGLGLNPHYGTPLNPWDRAARRIPGGSSSGAAVSVTDGMALAAIGTDTGGSVRIPAALCGLTGFKPTARRVPLHGAIPLSVSLDSIGPLAPTVACCALLDAVLAGEAPQPLAPADVKGLRLALPQRYVLEGMDTAVARTFARAVTRLASAGVQITEIPFAELDSLPTINAKGGFAAAEAWAWHRELIERAGAEYDPRVAVRIRRGAAVTESELVELRAQRAAFQQRALEVVAPHDALALPTVPIVAPRLTPLETDDAEYARVNILVLRNPTVGNFLDWCGLSIPCHAPGEAPVGFMLLGPGGADRRLLGVGAALERALSTDQAA
jgi:aspartyl-tRNA(Asn)/glutamyl-tRNA(Gln) amidotransferase subunit A